MLTAKHLAMLRRTAESHQLQVAVYTDDAVIFDEAGNSLFFNGSAFSLIEGSVETQTLKDFMRGVEIWQFLDKLIPSAKDLAGL